MSQTQAQTSTTAATPSRFQAIFDAALKSYQKQTKKDLLAHPLASQLQSCDSSTAIISLLQDQVREFEKSHSGDERLTKWLGPTVNVLCAFSAAISGGVGLVFSPASAIFAGVGVFISAAQDVSASKDLLAELFERIGYFFTRLETYTTVAPTLAMTEIITEIMVEVLRIFGIATKELRRGSTKKFVRKLAGMVVLECALKRLDRLTQEEARMALAEVLRITQSVCDEVKVVDSKVEDVIDRVQCIDGKVQAALDDGKQGRAAVEEAKLIIQQTASGIDEVKWNQLKQLLQAWLSPADPSTNHNVARKAQYKGTSIWFFKGSVVIEWKSTGSLLWIHGKPGSGKSVICSSVIEDVMNICETGLAVMAYFYFDFKDLDKQSCHDLLLSLVFQLAARSSPCCDILNRMYKTHESGLRQPSDNALKECLKEMLRLPRQWQIFIILDALDECPDSSGFPSPRELVLQLVKELVDLRLPELHICATSRPEVDIRAVLEPLAFRSVSLQDESGQKTDIANYVRNIVNLSPSMAMRRWRDDDKNLVIETLIERADGMFRWVFCQLETLRHCFPPNLRQFLNELPDGLDETYERILRGINKAQKEDARRLLQCLTVAARPLCVEELAELLAFDFQAMDERGTPTLREEWRWNDQEQAILSTCSSLITIVCSDGSRVVQFSHFSVKEYLTSPRLAQSRGDVSRFYVDLDAAHTILAQACLGTLLRLDKHVCNSLEEFPLVEYAARHWVEHAQSENVSSRVRNGMDDLFDSSKPHFSAWLRAHDMDKHWDVFSGAEKYRVGSPLYYAALCGFRGVAERLIMKDPEQVNAAGGFHLAPLPAALSMKHFPVANLLHTHGVIVDVRYGDEWTSLHLASYSGSVDIMWWLLNHGAGANARNKFHRTPLHMAARQRNLKVVQMLLDYNPEINARDFSGLTPLHDVISSIGSFPERRSMETMRLLLEYGADPNICNYRHSSPLHKASSFGELEIARLLLSHGANVDEKDRHGRTPFEVATSKGFQELTKLLLEHGAVP